LFKESARITFLITHIFFINRVLSQVLNFEEEEEEKKKKKIEI